MEQGNQEKGCMVNEFEASNGLIVSIDEDSIFDPYERAVRHYTLTPIGAEALREFFQHERDEELGRWRWPENPEYVVMDAGMNFATILHEPSMETGTWERGWRDTCSPADEAGVAYFEAHPNRKPWDDAKVGEVWAVKESGQPERAYMVDDSQFYDSSRDYALNLDDSLIIEARRIWPASDA